MTSGFFIRAAICAVVVALASTGCASSPRSRAPAPAKAASVQPAPEAKQSFVPPRDAVKAGSSAAAQAADHAVKMVGKPYRYGGSSPSSGFDCSGLIQFSFRQAGIIIPRSTDEQRRFAEKIPVSNLRQGDLLFFDQGWTKNSHAGIYLGDGKFVHAPSSGKRVRIDKLDAPYWKKHLSEVRRIGA